MPSGVYIRTDETRKKMSKRMMGTKIFGGGAKLGHKVSEETKIKIGNANRGRKYSDEAKLKISIASKGRISNRKGVTLSIETRKKLSDSHLGNVSGMKGKKHSEETKRKCAEATIRRYQNNKAKYNKDTKPELECERILKNNNINYTKQFRITNRLYDFYLSDYNLLIEVDGTFYHGKGIKDEDLKYVCQKKSRRIDKLKTELAKERGYNLIRVWEDEINQFEEYCKTMLFYNNYKQVV